MDKNTIWAIVLCGIVLFGYLVLDYVYIMPRQQAAQEQQRQELARQQEEQEQRNAEAQSLVSSQDSLFAGSAEDASAETQVSEYEVNTSKLQVLLTNRGGDIVSLKLREHKDKDTGFGVEMVDNVSPSNRAFSLSFGASTGAAVNDIFNVKRIDDYTIGFYKDFYRKDELGRQHKFRLGKLYTFKENEYAFRLSITVNAGEGEEDALNVDGASYTLRTSPQIGPHFDRKTDRYEMRQFLAFTGSKRVQTNFTAKPYTKGYDWAGVGGKYFAMLVKPATPANMLATVNFSTEQLDGYENSQVYLTRSAVSSGSVTDDYYVYVGPRSEVELIKYNSMDRNGWNLVNARFNEALNTGSLLSPVERVLKWAMEMIYRVVHNWGVAIIILTIILKIVLFPLNKTTAMGSIKMQQLQPQMQAIQAKYKEHPNPQKMQEETAKLYKQAGYNPAAGCLPMVLQMVVLFAMYRVFNNYFEFRGASFVKGWIDDLSVGDKLVTLTFNIPWLGSTLRLLPFVYTGSQLLNGLITQYGNAAMNTQSQASMKFMMYGMPLMFFFLFYNVPSGLLLYWTVSNILQIGQQLIINRMVKSKKEQLANAKPVVVHPSSSGKKGGKKKKRR